MTVNQKKKKSPSIDQWLKEAKADPEALEEGMYLVHNGTVRQTPRKKVREGIDDGSQVKGMEFDYDQKKVEQAVAEAKKMEGIFHVRVWLNQGQLEVGDDIMYVLIGGDIRPHVIDALQSLVAEIKNECVKEIEQKV
ncbi:molybdopterin synthase catalytic subunit [Halanaerobium saccharolyticum]|jgi:molybdopterin synthase catalytic subunit|uniref:Molybdopterin synthase catalytic subunit n=1 Tax=Halanaerobium saccharolyticum TaxID=43595 RepID=A0A2T5RL18_9FIRM|nr:MULTISPECIES: molybdenum cofactor biosynthesis protein MoaE [Halanaerobium]PTV99832.1 molybdopterin synthase catalytic subunit [Halanaerobium saccharolyticum]PUU88992.1 MAG: molybdopterin converting factor, large subunit [Halanaerobium sp.]PUU93086.1 MAG: molybdopterin converting factor, large subunit [Halanaerobium sp.]TDQ04005.1 molybdopterin synthase catalytic subunit [Halanaerobium saccharolyticum]